MRQVYLLLKDKTTMLKDVVFPNGIITINRANYDLVTLNDIMQTSVTFKSIG